MLSSENLKVAAQRMGQNRRAKKSDTQRVLAVAERMEKGDASPQDIAWAKRVAGGFLKSRN